MSISTGFEGGTAVADGDGDDYFKQGAQAAEDYANEGAAKTPGLPRGELSGGRGYSVLDLGRGAMMGAAGAVFGTGLEGLHTDRGMPMSPAGVMHALMRTRGRG